MYRWIGILLLYVSTLHAMVLNNPHTRPPLNETVYYSSFSEQPKTFDPAKSYSSNEYAFIGQMYEPLLQYDYEKIPYTLIPLTAASMPRVSYYTKTKEKVTRDHPNIAYTVYHFRLKHGILYQPHPAFYREEGGFPYLSLTEDEALSYRTVADFPRAGIRELVADDYIYQIKRLATPGVSSPIYGLMGTYIVGFQSFKKQLPSHSVDEEVWVDLRSYDMEGVKKIGKYEFDIWIKGVYPQFLYWLAMPFFSPIPWEVDKFYEQKGMSEHNLNLSWYPVGTGPFMLIENNPNKAIVLEKNPNYVFKGNHLPVLRYPSHAKVWVPSKPLPPYLDKAIYVLEKEAIPRWNKFIQGYYDLSGIATDNFDEAIYLDSAGNEKLTPSLSKRDIRLVKQIDPAIYYMGFNMLDKTVGGYSKRARLLRQAISIAINIEEQITIFMNGRGLPAQSPIPPGMLGYETFPTDFNPYVYENKAGKLVRKPITYAQQLLKKAGYANGIDPTTKKPLILHYDVAVSGSPDDYALLDWMRKQFNKLGIELDIRSTLYNRFQDKMRQGNAQIFSWGWMADYPDPENFLYGLYGLNSKVKYGGENASNYANPLFDALFLKMKVETDETRRRNILKKMIAIVRHDAPWVFGIHPVNYVLFHDWVAPFQTSSVIQNALQYADIDSRKRDNYQTKWNQANFWPIVVCLWVLFLPIVFGLYHYRMQKKSTIKRIE